MRLIRHPGLEAQVNVACHNTKLVRFHAEVENLESELDSVFESPSAYDARHIGK